MLSNVIVISHEITFWITFLNWTKFNKTVFNKNNHNCYEFYNCIKVTVVEKCAVETQLQFFVHLHAYAA